MRAIIERILSYLSPPTRSIIDEDWEKDIFFRYEVSNYPEIDPYHSPVIHSGAAKLPDKE